MATYNDTATDTFATADVNDDDYASLAEQFDWSDTTVLSITSPLIDVFRLSEAIALGMTVSHQVTDGFALREAIIRVWNELLTEEFQFEELVSDDPYYLALLIDRVMFGDTEVPLMTAAVAVTAAISLAEELLGPYFHSVTDVISVIETLATVQDTLIGDGIVMSETIVDTFYAIAPVSETINFADTPATTAQFFDELQEGIEFSIRLFVNATGDADLDIPPAGSGEYVGWAVNTENQAASTYLNMPFNSFATLPDGRALGCADDGVYLLEGDNDDTDDITAYIRSGLEDFGTGRMKSIPSAYIGYSSDGQLYLKMIVSENGIKNAYTYQMEVREAGTHTQGRVEIGKGLRSRYWAFELRNVDGSDFELDTLELTAVRLQRRMK